MGTVYLPLYVGGPKGERLALALVDTGAERTIVSSKLGKEIGLRGKEEELITTASGHDIKMKVARAMFRSDRLKIKGQLGVCLSDIPFQVEPQEGIEIIVGVDFLQKFNLGIKFHGSKALWSHTLGLGD
jgi:predicted aspartyl protease